MNAFTKLAAAVAATVAVGSFASSAQAAQFASYSPVSAGPVFHWDNATSTMSTTDAAQVQFSFVDPVLQAAGLTNLLADFSMSATVAPGNPAGQLGGNFVQPGLSGSFSFTTTQDVTINGTTYNAGSVLLGGTFANGFIQGAADSGSANGSTALTGGSVAFSSSFMDFTNPTSESFAFTLLDVSPSFGAAPGHVLNSFDAASTGNFSASLGPVPEPATWGLMLVGFGGMGAVLRRRRRALAFA